MTPIAIDGLDAAYRRFFPLLRGKCRRLLRTDAEAEEVAQEAFLRLVQSQLLERGGFADFKQVTLWLYRTSTRLLPVRPNLVGKYNSSARAGLRV